VAASATPRDGHVEKIEESHCYIYAPFDASLFVRTPGGDGYDLITYNMSYIQRRQMLLIAYDDFGGVAVTREYQEETPGVRRFAANEPSGNEASLTVDITRFLKEQKLFRCPD